MKHIFLLFLISLSTCCFSQKLILDKGFKNTVSGYEIAVMVINKDNNTLNQPLTQGVSDILQNVKGYIANPSFFNTDFIKDGSFEKIFKAEKFNIKKLHLSEHLDFICLGKYKVNDISKNEYDLFRADVTMQLNVIDAKSGAVIDSRVYTDKGTGVTKSDAESNGRNKLLEQLK